MDDNNLHDVEYQTFDPIIIGGETGDYSVHAPMNSAKWVEFNILNVATGDVVGAYGIVVSGNSKPTQPDWVAGAGLALDDDHVRHGTAFRQLASTNSPLGPVGWIRVTNSEHKVFIRIDAQAASSVNVTLQFRARLIKVIPGPSVEVHPDHAQELNKARAVKTMDYLKTMGVPGYAEENAPKPD